MKSIAVIGSGISGISAAYYLNKLGYDVTLLEASHYFGGHTNTVDINIDGKTIPVDTGFLVHNDRTYPNLIDFFEELDVKTHPSDMSFSVAREADNILWAGTNIWTLFAQKKNLFSPRFYRFIADLLKFNKNSLEYLYESEQNVELTLGQLLDQKGYGEDFKHWYLLPMGGCIWSTPTQQMLDFPAFTFLRFCINHGLLQINNRPQWKTVLNGCRRYVEKALVNIDKKYLNGPVEKISLDNGRVKVKTKNLEQDFDYCFFATHAPDSLKMIKALEHPAKDLLSAFQYLPNTAVLHYDDSVLPKKKSAWSAWNYLSCKADDVNDAVSVSYLINQLQPVDTDWPIIVTLNPITEIDPDKIFKTFNYEHPLFDQKAIKHQDKIMSIQGEQGLFFSGAWLRYGFHEDGILSTKKAIRSLLVKDGKDPDLMRIL